MKILSAKTRSRKVFRVQKNKTTDIRDLRDANHERKRENLFDLCYLCSKNSASLRFNKIFSFSVFIPTTRAGGDFERKESLFKYCVRAHFADMQHEMLYIAMIFCFVAHL